MYSSPRQVADMQIFEVNMHLNDHPVNDRSVLVFFFFLHEVIILNATSVYFFKENL